MRKERLHGSGKGTGATFQVSYSSFTHMTRLKEQQRQTGKSLGALGNEIIVFIQRVYPKLAPAAQDKVGLRDAISEAFRLEEI
ncbi:hypothetical protein EOD39_7399 [Acipenser ruthenus]|uniref:Uncharacterized protein n=1 Tax=Acipenser ruthenus TaxID=7906 RepID=A0A444U789_ACIRT|nr:hypothetical protein EOD39_7399 [Acipenser ruthenus]